MTSSSGRSSGPRAPGPAPAGSRALAAYLVLTAAVCGALVMVVEVLGSRVIGPIFGVSLFVWTSLITVTLVALALGYAAGGVLADRRGTPETLYAAILAAGLLTLLIPPLRLPVLQACLPLGLRLGSLASSAVLFGPALFLLGCVSPLIVKIAAREMESLGRTVGFFYAVSTLGSFAGTVLAGFVLIAWFPVGRIFLFTGVALVALAAGYFLLLRRKQALLALLAVPLLFLPPGDADAEVLADGTRIVKLLDRDTHYGKVKVLERRLGAARQRELLIDGMVQGGVDLANGLSVFGYSYFLQHLPRGLNPRGRDCLVVGLGAGVVPAWYARAGVRTDVVEINPEIVRAAADYFGFAPGGDVFVEDARTFVANTSRRYDYVILDVFTGDSTPGHLLSVEFFRLVRARLRERGVAALNIHGSLREDTWLTASVLATLRQTFGTVRAFPLFSPDGERDIGNVIVLAYDHDFPYPPALGAGLPLVHPDVYPVVRDFLWREHVLPAGTPAAVLTDDYNPAEFFGLKVMEEGRRRILGHTGMALLL